MVQTSLKGFSNFLILSMLYHYMNMGIQKDFEGIMIQKNAITGQSNEHLLSSFGYHPLGYSLPRSRFVDVTQRSPKRKDWGSVA